MRQRVLCFGDSNTWGYIAEGHEKNFVLRHSADVRWPGAAAKALGGGYTILEEGLNGRTTGFVDPSGPGRSGLEYLREHLADLLPVDTAVVALGVNDLKEDICGDVAKSRQMMGVLLDLIQEAGISRIVLVLPALLTSNIAGPPFQEDFRGGNMVDLSRALNTAYRELALARGLPFVDAAEIAQAGRDGLHLTADSHQRLGEAVASLILSLG